jgi:hypothetical protein
MLSWCSGVQGRMVRWGELAVYDSFVARRTLAENRCIVHALV